MKARASVAAAAIVATCNGGVLHAQSADWQAWLDSKAAPFSGVALVGQGDAIAVVAAYGIADRATGRANTAETRFNLGSINKTFTAIAIAQLIQQGRLSLDDSLAKVLPEYPNRATAATITIRDLLAHRSGVATFMRADFGDRSVAEMARVVGAEPQVFAPGARQEYSNGGYIVLGRVVEVVSAKSYTAYVAEHIYEPAGMTQCGFVQSGDTDATVALGYFSADAQGRPMMGASGGPMAANPLQPGNPAGGGYATAGDLFKFARALKNGRLLDARMTEYVMNGTFAGAPESRFGFALREQIVGSRRFIGNGGGAPGVNAEFRFEPAGDATVVVLANASPPAATKLLTEILNRLAGSAVSPASPPPPFISVHAASEAARWTTQNGALRWQLVPSKPI
jgi:CubicO group peptidase (beta-lactamase class C family)